MVGFLTQEFIPTYLSSFSPTLGSCANVSVLDLH
jgi:hypothetical protein